MNRQEGVVPILIVILIVLAVSGYLIYNNYLNNRTKVVSPLATTNPIPAPTGANVSSESTGSALSPAPTGAGETANWKTYTNSALGFSFSYPKELNYIYDQFGFNHPDNPEGNLLLQNYDGSKLSKDDSANFQMEVDAYKNTDQATLEKYVKDPNKVWNINNAQTFTSLILGNEPALKGQAIQKNEKVPTLWVAHKGYILTIHSETPNSQNASWFNQILSTFKFTQ